jgi:hypothetical protein
MMVLGMTTTALLADDPLNPPDDGGGTNGLQDTGYTGSTNFPPAYPLNLITSCLLADSPQNLSSWADLDSAVSAGYDQLLNSSSFALYPPGQYKVVLDGGLFVFSTNGDIAANLALFQPSSTMGVTLWKMGVIETQMTARSWVYMGASDGTNSVAFRTQAVPSGFDPQAWVQAMPYGTPPSYLTGSDLTQWYSDRDRSRVILGMTFINTNDLPTLQAAIQAAQANATNSVTGANPALPADTNRVAFAGLAGLSADGRLGVWVYSPINNLPVDVFTRPTMTPVVNGWTLLGTVLAKSPFTLWYAPPGVTNQSAFFTAARADIDSDGDGIPDDREILVFGTNPYNADSDGDGLSDWEEIYLYGTNPLNRNSNNDGWDDDEAILAGLNPLAWNSGGGGSSEVRYYYDADDRLTGAYAASATGTVAGATAYTLAPAHDVSLIRERGVTP